MKSPSILWSALLLLLAMSASSASALTVPGRTMRTLGSSIGDRTTFYSPTVIRNTNARSSSTISRLLYARSDAQDDMHRRGQHVIATRALRTKLTGLWSNMFAQTSEAGPSTVPSGDDKQEVVDEYLEFLDKRYHRLHDDERPAAAAPSKQFSAWDWLMDGSKDKVNQAESFDRQLEDTNDALYVLGVAGLASERLLQKHHISVGATAGSARTSSEQERVIETTATTVGRTASVMAPTAAGLEGVLAQVRDRRRALIRYQEKQLKRLAAGVLAALVKAPLQAKKGAQAIWRYGGAKKTLALTLTAFCAVFLLVRPVLTILGEFVINSGFIEP